MTSGSLGCISIYTKLWLTVVTALGSMALGIRLLWPPGGMIWFFLFVMLVPLGLLIVRMSIRCKSCGYPLAVRERRVFGLTLRSIRTVPPRRCPRCKDDLKMQI